MNAPNPGPATTADGVLDRWEAAREQGRAVSLEELCRDCPQLLDQVRRQVQALEAFDSMVATIDVGTLSPAASAALPNVPGYEIEAELGRGGMGVVFKARQIKLNRTVALKMILAGTFAGSETRNRFRVEAEAVARLQHPNIVQVFEVGEVDGQPFAALEFVPGGTLAEQLDRRPIAPTEAAALAETIAHAVQHAHERGIIHRDLKPGNILLTHAASSDAHDLREQAETREASPGTRGDSRRPGHKTITLPPTESRIPNMRFRLSDATPKVTDFGLAKLLDTPATERRTETGSVFGTPSYMAPEQARGDTRNIGPLADVYALGAMLYEFLTGRPPFQGEGVVEVLQRVSDTEPVPPRELLASIPRDLETVCLKCLEKDPGKRYPSAAALAEDLRRFLDGLPVIARPVGRFERGVRWCRRNPRVATLLGLVAALLVTTAVVSTMAAVDSKRSADRLRTALGESQLRLAESDRTRGQLLCEGGDIDIGLLWFARSLEDLPQGHDDLDAAIREELGLWLQNHRPLEAVLTHPEEISLLTLSPDGSRLLTVSGKHVQLWDARTAKPGPALRPAHEVHAAAFSPDGKFIALGGSGPDHADDRVSLWHTATGKAAGMPLTTGRNKPVQALAWSLDGRYLAAGTANLAAFFDPQELFVWDAKSGELIGPNATIQGHFTAIAFSPDSKTLAAFTTRNLLDGGAGVGFFNPADMKPQGEAISIPAPGPGVSAAHALAFTANGKNVWTVNGGRACRWDVGSGRLLDAVPVPAAGSGVVGFTRSGDALWSADGSVGRFTLAGSGRTSGSPLRHGASISQIATVADGAKVFTGSRDGTVRVWGTAGTTAHTYPAAVRVLANSGNGKHMFSADQSGQARIHAASGTSITLPITSRVFAAAFSPDGAMLLTVGGPGGKTLHAWRTTDGSELHPPLEHGGFISQVQFSPDGKRVLTVSSSSVAAGDKTVTSGRVQVWDAATGKAAGTPIDAVDRLFSLAAFSGGNWGKLVGVTRRLLTRDVEVGVWDLATGQPDGAAVAVPGLATPDGIATASPDGAWVALPDLRGGVRLWDVATRTFHELAAASPDSITVLVWSADGKQLVVGKEGGLVGVYDVGTRRLAFQVQAHTGRVRGGGFTPDGKRLVTFGIDGLVRQWDTTTGAVMAAPFVHPDGVWVAALSPDGTTLTTGCQDGIMRTWQRTARVSGTPAEVVRAIEKRTGLRLGTDGSVRAFTAEEWAAR